jgi:hypothetical protein
MLARPDVSGERPRELGPWKSVGVEEEHENRRERGAVPGRATPCWRNPAGDLGEVRIAAEREASGEAPFFILTRTDHRAASASGA